MKILVDSHVHLRNADLDDRLDRSIRHALEFANPEKANAKKEHIWRWEDLPDKVQLWNRVGDELVLPRGFLGRLVSGLKREGYGWELDDDRTEVLRTWSVEGAMKQVKLDPRRGQPSALGALLEHEQGILMAPPGMGKTSTMLELVRQSHQRSLIIVETTHIAGQWRDRAEDFLGVELGLLGDSTWEEKDVTVALRQSLWSRYETLEADGFFDRWGLVCADECHHVQAMALSNIVSRFPARFRYGLSATPDRDDGNFAITAAVLGDVVHETSKLELVNSGVLVTPEVTVVPTAYRFPFKPTRRLSNGRVIRNNWEAMVKNLISDEHRNDIVADEIVRRWPDRQLVLSKRLKHLKLLRQAVIDRGYPEELALLMTGAQDSEERLRIARLADRSQCVIFSTVADEALDVPRLEVVHLPFPTASAAIVAQQVGRVERAAKGKTRAEVVDYHDSVNVLARQHRTRLAAYRSNGYDVPVL